MIIADDCIQKNILFDVTFKFFWCAQNKMLYSINSTSKYPILNTKLTVTTQMLNYLNVSNIPTFNTVTVHQNNNYDIRLYCIEKKTKFLNLKKNKRNISRFNCWCIIQQPFKENTSGKPGTYVNHTMTTYY